MTPGLSAQTQFRTNSLGIRGREFSKHDAFRVLALGCSVTLSEFVDQELLWTSVLERQLRAVLHEPVWAGSVGRSEVPSRDLCTFAQYFLPQISHQLSVVICLIGVNDMALMLSKGSSYDPNYYDTLSPEARIRRCFVRTPQDETGHPLRPVLSRLKHQFLPDKFYAAGDFYLEKRARRRAAPRVIHELPDLGPGLDEFERNLRALAAMIGKLSVQLVLVTQPSIWRDDLSGEEESLLWFGWAEQGNAYYTPHLLAEAMDAYNKRLMRVAKDLELPCVDLAARLPRDTTVLYDDVHFNDNGSRLAAHELLESLVLLVKDRA